MTLIATFLGGALVLLGAAAAVSSAVGVLRFPDFYARLHAAGVGDTLGAGLVIAGLLVITTFQEGGWLPALVNGELAATKPGLLVCAKLISILLFLWISGTTATHALAKAAWTSGLEPWKREGGGPSKP